MSEWKIRQESLKQWCLKYFDSFREEYEKLSDDERRGINNVINFLNPCQIEIFWIDDPDFQLIVQSNFEDRPDREIIVNGPYKPHEFHSKVIVALNEKRWMRSIKHNMPYGHEQFDVLGERMTTEICRLVEMSKNYPFMSNNDLTNHTLLGMAVEDTWIRIRSGNIGELDHVQEVCRTIQDIKQNAKTKQNVIPSSQPPTQSADTYDGFGVHLFPPIVIGTVPKRSIEELIYNTSNIRINDKIFDMRIGNSQIIVNKDGFIFVESKNKEHTLKILNLIMAHGAFYGFPLYAVREHELVMVNYDKQELTVTGMQWNSETRRAYLVNDSFNSKYSDLLTKTEVTSDTMKEILSNTEKLLEDEKLSEDMRLLNDGLTHFTNSEFAQSFIISWSVIERHYSSLWNALLLQKNIDSQRLGKLINSNYWTFDYVLEVLTLQDKIDENSYDLLMELKSKRNKYYHNGKQVIREDADRCLKYTVKLLVDRIYPHIRLSSDLMLSKYHHVMNTKS